ncbi:hypothetical protein [Streptomyces sp. NPDC001507]|uniref:hypothetical protein n=1 Tax=Streptomyces sp. NPDC001507 TaxID=3364579 RepID=UPI0036853A42
MIHGRSAISNVLVRGLACGLAGMLGLVERISLPQRGLAIVRGAGGPGMVKQVGEELRLELAVPGKLEPLRGKVSKLAGRGWLRKLPTAASPRACELPRGDA